VQLLRHNRRRIEQAIASGTVALGQRYQQIENMRTVRIFSFVTLTVSIGVFVMLVCAFLIVTFRTRYIGSL
jgi:hypothetical protein